MFTWHLLWSVQAGEAGDTVKSKRYVPTFKEACDPQSKVDWSRQYVHLLQLKIQFFGHSKICIVLSSFWILDQGSQRDPKITQIIATVALGCLSETEGKETILLKTLFNPNKRFEEIELEMTEVSSSQYREELYKLSRGEKQTIVLSGWNASKQ